MLQTPLCTRDRLVKRHNDTVRRIPSIKMEPAELYAMSSENSLPDFYRVFGIGGLADVGSSNMAIITRGRTLKSNIAYYWGLRIDELVYHAIMTHRMLALTVWTQENLEQFFDWYIIPQVLIEELKRVPAGHMFGAGVLMQDCWRNTALVSLAEAATAQLPGVVELLACIVYVVDDSIEHGPTRAPRRYNIRWRYKRYDKCAARILTVPLANGGWVLGVQNGSEPRIRLGDDTMRVLAWLQAILESSSNKLSGDRNLTIVRPPQAGELVPSLVKTFKIADESAKRLSWFRTPTLTAREIVTTPSLPDEREGGCWRIKIKSGVVLARQHRVADPPISMFPPAPVSMFPHDCLVLTVAALWKLFDNSLRPMPHCQCTLETEAGEFLSCERKVDVWYIWHLSLDRNDVCGGKLCTEKVRIIMEKGKGMGFSLAPESPCILGWRAGIRETIYKPIAEDSAVSAEFRKHPKISLQPKTVSLTLQIGLSKVVNFGLNMGVSLDLKQYDVGSTIPMDMETQSGSVLVYCETRRVHLLMTGADVIELVCIQLLKNQNCKINSASFDRLNTATGRMVVWRTGIFPNQSEDDTYISGKELFRAASERVRDFFQLKEDDRVPLYWPLQDIILGRSSNALQCPEHITTSSWYQLATNFPILIVAVGQISDDLFSVHYGKLPLRMVTRGKIWRRSKKEPARGGLLAENDRISALLDQAEQVYRATLEEVEEGVSIGSVGHQAYRILKVPSDRIIRTKVSCRDCESTYRTSHVCCCIHYFR